ncbi:MAG: hypothetical protein NVS4B12_12190 [Ktedonobacteraceae bacterium]
MSKQVDTSYLQSLSSLAVQAYDTTRDEIEDILRFIVKQLGMESSYYTHISDEPDKLQIVAAYNIKNGCQVPEHTFSPLTDTF